MSSASPVDIEQLRRAVQDEYAEVARNPDKGFHFHTGRTLARMLDYRDEWLEGIPEENIASFAGVGKPFTFGALKPGERVVDIGSGAGLDSLIASKMVGPEGRIVGPPGFFMDRPWAAHSPAVDRRFLRGRRKSRTTARSSCSRPWKKCPAPGMRRTAGGVDWRCPHSSTAAGAITSSASP